MRYRVFSRLGLLLLFLKYHLCGSHIRWNRNDLSFIPLCYFFVQVRHPDWNLLRIFSGWATRLDSWATVWTDWQVGLLLSVLIIIVSMVLSYVREAALDEIDAQDADAEVQAALAPNLPQPPAADAAVAAAAPPAAFPPPRIAPREFVPPLNSPAPVAQSSATTFAPAPAAATGAADSDTDEELDPTAGQTFSSAAPPRPLQADPVSPRIVPPGPVAQPPPAPAPLANIEIVDPGPAGAPVAAAGVAVDDEALGDNDDDEGWEEIPLTHFIGVTGSFREFCMFCCSSFGVAVVGCTWCCWWWRR